MNTLLCSLEELAKRRFQHDGKDYVLDIPAFQRGLVWNPAQVEVLWDSLMRGIPIGSITLIKYANDSNLRRGNEEKATHGIFDGQQRLNAIKLGLTPYSSAQSILWLDLLPEDSAVENNPHMWWIPSRHLSDAPELSPWHREGTLCRTALMDQADMDQIVREVCDILKSGGIEPCVTS